MTTIINISPLIKVEQDGNTFYGQQNGKYLWTDAGTVLIKEDAVITEIKQQATENIHSPFSQKEPDTQYEIWQRQKYQNFIQEEEDLSDELRQWHWY